MDKQEITIKDISLENVIAASIQLPLVRVDRSKFLLETFSSEPVERVQEIIDLGPIEAQVTQEQLSAIAKRLIYNRTGKSSAASFIAGMPGGLAMAATIPADVLQFFGTTLRLAQELSYLYGAEDLWENGTIDNDLVRDRLMLYCGVMFGVSGAVSGVRVLTAKIAQTTLKRLPQKALTKTFWYPIIKKIGKAVGTKITKTVVAESLSKAVPIVGGVISGSMNFASMVPMAKRLQTALDSAAFGYTEEAFSEDLSEIEKIAEELDEVNETEKIVEVQKEDEPESSGKNAGFRAFGTKIMKHGKQTADGISDLFSKVKQKQPESSEPDIPEMIQKLAELKESGILTEEEFEKKKAELLERL